MNRQRKQGIASSPLVSGAALRVGEVFVVTGGPLKGRTGVMVEDRQARVVLSVPVADHSVLVEMDREWIMPVSIRAQSSTNLSNQATYERLPT